MDCCLTAFFHNLGVGPAMSVLGGIALLMLPIPFVLYVLLRVLLVSDTDLVFAYDYPQVSIWRHHPNLEQIRELESV